jgi:hypothetical protein
MKILIDECIPRISRVKFRTSRIERLVGAVGIEMTYSILSPVIE